MLSLPLLPLLLVSLATTLTHAQSLPSSAPECARSCFTAKLQEAGTLAPAANGAGDLAALCASPDFVGAYGRCLTDNCPPEDVAASQTLAQQVCDTAAVSSELVSSASSTLAEVSSSLASAASSVASEASSALASVETETSIGAVGSATSSLESVASSIRSEVSSDVASVRSSLSSRLSSASTSLASATASGSDSSSAFSNAPSLHHVSLAVGAAVLATLAGGWAVLA
ncbi:hypothetical protein JCM6882_001384 [Rhodosporidiobolus microsporus]